MNFGITEFTDSTRFLQKNKMTFFFTIFERYNMHVPLLTQDDNKTVNHFSQVAVLYQEAV